MGAADDDNVFHTIEFPIIIAIFAMISISFFLKKRLTLSNESIKLRKIIITRRLNHMRSSKKYIVPIDNSNNNNNHNHNDNNHNDKSIEMTKIQDDTKNEDHDRMEKVVEEIKDVKQGNLLI